MIRIFIGYDRHESIAYHVLAHSIMRHASEPVSITPLYLGNLPMFTREREAQSTDFAFSRFLVPYLSGYEGRSIFMDCDMLARADIAPLLRLGRDCDVFAVQHDYVPASGEKFLGNKQVAYPRKNWSSMMVFNNERCKTLTPGYVNAATAKELHRFEWTDSIGSVPREWNWLVGEYPKNASAKLVHFTNGGPWFREYVDADYADEWRDEYARVVTTI